jgi:hypothetical protein
MYSSTPKLAAAARLSRVVRGKPPPHCRRGGMMMPKTLNKD